MSDYIALRGRVFKIGKTSKLSPTRKKKTPREIWDSLNARKRDLLAKMPDTGFAPPPADRLEAASSLCAAGLLRRGKSLATKNTYAGFGSVKMRRGTYQRTALGRAAAKAGGV